MTMLPLPSIFTARENRCGDLSGTVQLLKYGEGTKGSERTALLNQLPK